MKLSSAILCMSMIAGASASKSISGKNAAKVLRSARRVEEGDDAADEFEFLQNYSLKLVGCKTEQNIYNAENGEYEYSAAIFRLCPTSSGCDSDSTMGCSSDYGDYVVGLNTFVDAYLEDQKDNMNYDDNAVEADRFAKCAEYEMDEGDDANANEYAGYAFYIGPTCTEDETDVRLAVFEDEYCVTESDVSFGDISQGWTLPYSAGGLVSDWCLDCYYANEDGDYELREMCTATYEVAAYACEEKMEYFSYYGQNLNGCDTIKSLMPSKGGKGGKVFGWFLFFLVVGGAVGYVMWWRKKKSAATDGLVA
eukprot:Nitzschia sp. Nitz4//scaffold104_size75438//5126//6241//NITZ4_005648-RA/size75438-snap-gene-0.118-mRNA-1//-1//CDS//3329532362//9016//frame0